MSTETPETDRNVTAFFDTREAAETAVSQVAETGLPREKILLRAGAARKAAFVDDGKGLLQEVKELILPSEEPDAAVEALKHEGFLLSVRPNPESHDAIFKLLEQAGGRGIESREDIWPDWKSGHDGGRQDEYPEGSTPEERERPRPADVSSAAEEPAAESEPPEPSGDSPRPPDRKPEDSDQQAASG